ncbi:sacsin N-terminal ATP-binding-like domain-containing protein [Isoptericola sp. b408]|uniref:sacsin N-terminal ATP-binding-like domain-containing protein n=1 Tax=Isoptericola sp. b408 TaxID=3064653 RepID=UPI0027123CBC|nr:ATP-binding protein [Isoptericola sp. b408]MDO8152287.1 ATP-binding protein [Isoptericola sp. b408]
MTTDVFGTAALRHAVTEAWLGSATRFREDANSEEDHARGHYRDRVVVELLQNAADAAARAGVPGRVEIALDTSTRVLRVANTGHALDADGVASLASLRASAKDGAPGEVGRFGVGFAAVRGVSDDVTISSRDGGVRFDLDETRTALATLTSGDVGPDRQRLAADVAGRGDDLPVLRLPFPAPALDAGSAADTVVELRLRDTAAVEAVRRQLAELDDVLLLAFPAVDHLSVAVTTASGTEDERTWDRSARTAAPQLDRSGRFTAADVADLPREHRRPDWSLVWTLQEGRRVLHAPTPTDVVIDLPAVLLATFPVDAGRRRVLPGPATDRLAAEAGAAYAELLGSLAADRATDPAAAPDPLDLVPTGLPGSELDAAVRESATAALRGTPLLGASGAEDGGAALEAPQDALVVAGDAGGDADLVAALAPVLPGLVRVPARHQATVRSLGATVVALADLVDDLPAGLPAARWHDLLDSLAPYANEPGVLESLAGARVPLADGRVAGVRSAVVLPEGSVDDGDEASLAATARVLGLRVVHPDVAHPLLVRAGAVATDAHRMLQDPEVRRAALDAAEAVLDGDGDDGAREVVASALALVRLTGGADAPFWTGELPVPTADGELVALREATLPGTWAAEVLDGLAPVGAEYVARYGAPVLTAAGARTDPDVYIVPDVITPDPDEADDDGGPDDAAGWLGGWSDYLRLLTARFGPGVALGDLVAVADLDAVADDAWPRVLARLAGDPDTRRALLTPVRRGRAAAPSYSAWWLRERFGAPFALHDGVPLLPPEPRAVAGLDVAVRRALGGADALGDLDPTDWPAALDRLPAVGSPLPLRDALVVWRGLTSLAERLDAADRSTALDPLPDRLPVLDASDVVVQPAEDVVVAGTARWAALGAVVPAPESEAEGLAELLDLPLAGQDGLPSPDQLGTEQELDPRLAVLDHRLPAVWFEHERLSVAGRPVPWWVDAQGRVHATSAAGLAAGLADVLGRPDRVALLSAVLREPERAVALWATTAWG